MAERDTDVPEILFVKCRRYGDVNFILGKALCVLPETKLP